MDFIIHPRSTAISHFQRSSIRTDSAEIRRATGFSPGTALFSLYTSDVISIAASLGVGAHSYADDSHLYLQYLAIDQSTAALRLAECIERVDGWMKSNRLKLNSDNNNNNNNKNAYAGPHTAVAPVRPP